MQMPSKMFVHQKTDVVIGIDPDTDKSGIAWLNTTTRILETYRMTFPKLIEYLSSVKSISEQKNISVVVIIEASWVNTHNRHLKSDQSREVVSKTGYNVGRNHQIGIDICNYAKHIGLNVIEQVPLKKGWNGRDGKITHKELQYFTRIEGRTNQEERDAALLAWNHANLPFRMKSYMDKKRGS